jgi:hypothetical protein
MMRKYCERGWGFADFVLLGRGDPVLLGPEICLVVLAFGILYQRNLEAGLDREERLSGSDGYGSTSEPVADKTSGRACKYFVGGATARSAALLTGINRHTATLFFRKLREVIAQRLNEETPELLGGEVEIDEVISAGAARANGGAALAARFPSSDCSSGAARPTR